MKHKTIWFAVLVAAGIGGLVFLAGCRVQFGADSEKEMSEAEQASIPVRVVEAAKMTLPQTVSYSGTIEPWEMAHITGQAGQRIAHIHVREGERVSRGQLVAEMDDSSLRQAEVELRIAGNELERLERLVEIGSVARQQYEHAKARHETAQSTVEMLRKNTHLESPIDGVVTHRHFLEGEQFLAGPQTPSIVTVQQMNPLRVVINVAERYFPVVRQGMTAEVRLDTYEERVFEVRVERVNPVVSVENRTFRVEVRLDNRERLLSPGMFARVTLVLGEVSGVFLPRSALRTDPGNGEAFVYVVEGDVAHRVPVSLGVRVAEYQEVVDGLPEAALVVMEGVSRLSDGSRIRIVR